MADYRCSIKNIKGVGEKKAQLFQKRLGLFTLGDLLTYYPRAYQDWSKPYRIVDAPSNEEVCIKGKISTKIEKKQSHKSKTTLYSFTVYDRTGAAKITLFNNEYLAKSLQQDKTYLFFGKIRFNGVIKEMTSPEIRPEDYAKIRPIYPATAGLSSRMIERVTENAVQMIENEETLPQDVLKRYNLTTKANAMRQIHFPDSFETLQAARRRLCFEEIFYLRMGMRFMKNRTRRSTALPITPIDKNEAYSIFPFELTNGQKSAIDDCLADMAKSTPMNRLVQGDVGCGKTAVAAVLCYHVIANNHACIFLAPTEILAKQHAKSLQSIFATKNIPVELLTGSTKAAEKRRIKTAAADGAVQIIVATHAVISNDVILNNVGLIITDEQHRFGVAQRSALSQKAHYPHTLVMSATPIPRTLGLAIYGDLEISVISQLPAGRKPIASYGVNTDYRERALNYVKKHLDSGLQGYIVCPAIEENEESDTGLISATEYYNELSRTLFSEYRLGLLHAKMKPTEKQEIMQQFCDGQIQLLISTTVIEVGVDVPNAAIMLIENAERFGLSQLHQLRGRVGRGSSQSTCIFIYEGTRAKERIDILCQTNDGFKIAEEDLKLRGPGNFLGHRQHGLPDLKIADIVTDAELIKTACYAADELLSNDPLLEDDMHKIMHICINDMFYAENSVDLN